MSRIRKSLERLCFYHTRTHTPSAQSPLHLCHFRRWYMLCALTLHRLHLVKSVCILYSWRAWAASFALVRSLFSLSPAFLFYSRVIPMRAQTMSRFEGFTRFTQNWFQFYYFGMFLAARCLENVWNRWLARLCACTHYETSNHRLLVRLIVSFLFLPSVYRRQSHYEFIQDFKLNFTLAVD